MNSLQNQVMEDGKTLRDQRKKPVVEWDNLSQREKEEAARKVGRNPPP